MRTREKEKKIDYRKKEREGQERESSDTMKFEIDHLNNEHLVSVEGYHDEESRVIQALQFKTNIKTSELIGYEKGKKFSLGEKGKKIIGFHGYAEMNLNSLGAYFTTVSITKSAKHGGNIGHQWDDGVFGGIQKVYVGCCMNRVKCITFDYNNGHTIVKRQHGWSTSFLVEFELDYPNEFITSMDGTFTGSRAIKMNITSLVFKTSKGRSSPTFGIVTRTKFVLETKGCAIVGFHGRTFFDSLSAIGAYFASLPLPPTAEKLEARGYDRGACWDDGVYDGVRKIYIGQCENGIAFLKFVYDKDVRMVIGNDHGNKTPLEVKELELEFPDEHITAVEGFRGKGNRSEVEVITMLRFKTNKRTSISFGFESRSSFVRKKEGYKIVGFHGKASNMIHQLGVHVVLST
ncbi:unnamed protein product [Microthlaspi erraticum]|uniref:Jacalin-type lectin domain-containing protein n=1 Tax=Microthlaspi erraticum TaxID=1685480 RepID=A0A6D2ISX5_9BRAS|nr:unnamed protein product [Microthlaspi erraticum]